MTAIAMQISDKLGRFPENGTAEALARYATRRWPEKSVQNVMAEWGLTEGEAKGVVYGSASRSTIDKIKRHPRGGWSVMVDVDAMVIGESIQQHMEKRLAEIRRARAAAEAEERRSLEILRSISAARRR